MGFQLKCCEWINMNRNARKIKNKLSKNSEFLGDESIYVLQIVGNRQQTSESSLLACLTSDQIIQVYDQSDLKLKQKIRNSHETNSSTKTINEIGFFKQNSNMLFSCGDDGFLKCWDLRQENADTKAPMSSAICIDYLKGKRELLCADINLDDNIIMTGTNRNIDDSVIYLFDIRFADKYMFKFCESHSKDISQVKFDPNRAKKFSSSSIDGLVCLYDLDMKQEDEIKANADDRAETDEDDEDEDPDLMEQVFNTDSSVQKIGYLNTNPMVSNASDMLYAITYTSGLFVWDLNTHDLIFKKEIKSEKEEDYFFECFYFKSRRDELPLLTSCMADKRGDIKVIQNEEILTEVNKSSLEEQGDEMLNRRMHRDIIRGSYWNDETSHLYTVGDDGFLIKWSLSEKLNQNNEKRAHTKRERKDDEMSEDDVDVDFKNKKKFMK
jgi:WD40 repeat protein